MQTDPSTKRSKVELADGTTAAQETANPVELDAASKAAVIKQIQVRLVAWMTHHGG